MTSEADPKRIGNGPETDPKCTPNGSETDPKRTKSSLGWEGVGVGKGAGVKGKRKSPAVNGEIVL